MDRFSTIIVGGGAAGLLAAISAKRRGVSVAVCERMPKLGKKILASGNGRCNLLNDTLDESFYNPAAQNLVKTIFTKFGKNDILDFFHELGLEVYSEGGRIFPRTNQASSVLKVLEIELERLSIPIELNYDINSVSRCKDGFEIKSKAGKTLKCDKVIIAGGGRSYSALGSDGSCYNIVKGVGFKVVKPVPSAVPLVVKDRLCHFLQGQKISASVKALAEGRVISESTGDLLFTKYGLSGTAILDVSEDVSIALNRDNKKNVSLSVDIVPFMEKEALQDAVRRRMTSGRKHEDILAGILPNKFGPLLKDLINKWNAQTLTNALKNWNFKVLETKGWNEAEFTSGGIDTAEVDYSTLESKTVKGLYFAGEVLDVCGKRGGYNLAWAWASGYVAGSSC